jgi:hypothetical protein
MGGQLVFSNECWQPPFSTPSGSYSTLKAAA